MPSIKGAHPGRGDSHSASIANGDFIELLAGIVGRERLFSGPQETAPFYRDWIGRFEGRGLCVVQPASCDEVAAIVKLCHQYQIAVVTQGGNTGLCGGATPMGGEVVISLTRMNRVREIDADNSTMTVEAGCILHNVQAKAEEAGFLFPLSLAAEGTATIGGNLATNAGGTQVLRYGNSRELCLGLEVVLPDGRVWDSLKGLRKDNTGYDLKHLFIGSEGTLGIITAAVLKLYPQSRQAATAWAVLEDVQNAVKLLNLLRNQLGDRVVAFELISEFALRLVLDHVPNTVDPLPDGGAWRVLIEVSDARPGKDLIADFEQALTEAFEAGVIKNVAVAQSLKQSDDFWRIRESIPDAQKIEGPSVKHDISVLISRVPEFIRIAEKSLHQNFPGMRVLCFGHVGDGNLHYNVSAAVGSGLDRFGAKSGEVSRLIYDLVHEFNGSISAEHGLGQLKCDDIKRYKPSVEIELTQGIKRLLDPQNVMNPGKVVSI